MFVNFNILNQLGSPAINSNTFANRPAAGQTGRLFVSTDTFEIYRDNGTTWDLIGGPGSSTITGTGTATQVAYFTSSQAIGSSANLYWDNTSGFLGVGTAAPTTRIEAVKTDGIGIYSNYTTNAGSGSSATAIWAKNVTNSSGYGAVIEETTPNATAGQYPLLIKHSLSSGTAGVGMGTGVHWQLPDDAGTFKTTQLTVETINAAAATYATRYRFNVQSNGSSTPVAYINSTGLGIFTATPGAALDIHSTGTIAQFNTTAATGNVFLAIQRSGTGLWRIGDTYNGGSNFFELHNTTLASNAIQIDAATNKSIFTSVQNYVSGLARANYFDYTLNLGNFTTISSPNAVTSLGATLNLNIAGSATLPNGARSGMDVFNGVNFTSAGTFTINQASTIRAYSNLTSGWAFNGSDVGTITHLAGMRVLFPTNSGSAINVTNNYALLINNQNANTGTINYTNRWGIYQEGASDLNYMAANLLLGSTVNTGDKLQVTGTATISSSITANSIIKSGGTSSQYLMADGSTSTLTNPVTGTGTTNYIPKFTSSSAIGNSIISESGGVITVNGGITMNGTMTIQSSGIVRGYFGDVDGDNNVQLRSQAALTFKTGGNNLRATLDASGNLGLGQAPNSTWNANCKAIQIKDWTSLSQRSDGAAVFGMNIVETTPNSYSYLQSFSAGRYQILGNTHTWNIAPSGTGGNAITFTQAMTLDGSGNLGIGVSPTKRLHVYGSTLVFDGILLENSLNNAYSIYQAKTGNSSVWQWGVWNDNSFKTGISGVGDFTTITSGGNFLIGTTTDAGQKLQVSGQTYLAGPSSTPLALQIISGNSNADITLQSASSSAVARIRNGVNDLQLHTNGSLALTLTSAQNAELVGSIKTAAPSGGTAAAWKLGSRVASTMAFDSTQYIEVDIGGTLYKLALAAPA